MNKQLTENRLAVSTDAGQSIESANYQSPDRPVDYSTTTATAEAAISPVSATGGLQLRIENVRPGLGVLRVAIFKSESDFTSRANAIQKFQIEASGVSVNQSIQLPQNSKVAIAVYQDLNGDGELNKGPYGIPSEPYAFSNNAKGYMGPPNFSDAAIDLSVASDIATITL